MASSSVTPPIKQRLIEALAQLPDDASFDDAIERLHFVYAVELGLAQAQEGRLIPHDEVKKTWREWAR
jgi:predicted transcriptional regulator